MTECLKCKSQNVVAGRLVDNQRTVPIPIGFKPASMKWHQFALTGSVELKAEALACLDCGFVWSSAAHPEVLRELARQVDEPE